MPSEKEAVGTSEIAVSIDKLRIPTGRFLQQPGRLQERSFRVLRIEIAAHDLLPLKVKIVGREIEGRSLIEVGFFAG